MVKSACFLNSSKIGKSLRAAFLFQTSFGFPSRWVAVTFFIAKKVTKKGKKREDKSSLFTSLLRQGLNRLAFACCASTAHRFNTG
jgi:hypothetical protein